MNRSGKVALLPQAGGRFEINEHPVPRDNQNSLLLRVELCGVCGTDVHIFNGKHSDVEFPIVLGHEIVGTVEANGIGDIHDYLGNPVQPGDRIILTPAMYCGKCYFCSVAKTPVRCINPAQYGFFSRNEAASPFNGGYSQYVSLDYSKTDFFKTNISPEAGIFAEPLAVSFHSVIRASVRPGDTVVVQGAGSLGLLHVLAAKIAGAARIIMVTRRKTAKLDLARSLGADITITMEEIPERDERIRIVRESSINRYGADSVFECVGVPAVIGEGIAYVRDSGTYCIVGHAVNEGAAEINPADIMNRNIRIEGIFDHSVEDFYKSFTVLEREQHSVAKILSHKIPLADIDDAFECLSSKKLFDGSEITKAAIAPWA